MATVDVVARNKHRGHINTYAQHIPLGGGTKGGDIRPVCDSCGWQGPKYGPSDIDVARVGLEAHIDTTEDAGGVGVYEICVRRNWTFVWDWAALEWQ